MILNSVVAGTWGHPYTLPDHFQYRRTKTVLQKCCSKPLSQNVVVGFRRSYLGWILGTLYTLFAIQNDSACPEVSIARSINCCLIHLFIKLSIFPSSSINFQQHSVFRIVKSSRLSCVYSSQVKFAMFNNSSTVSVLLLAWNRFVTKSFANIAFLPTFVPCWTGNICGLHLFVSADFSPYTF